MTRRTINPDDMTLPQLQVLVSLRQLEACHGKGSWIGIDHAKRASAIGLSNKGLLQIRNAPNRGRHASPTEISLTDEGREFADRVVDKVDGLWKQIAQLRRDDLAAARALRSLGGA